MNEVLTHPRRRRSSRAARSAVKEWCINTAAVDPLTQLGPGQQRRRLPVPLGPRRRNQLTQRIQLTSGLGESYTPTAIGADGAVYAINNAVLFSIAR